MKGAIFGLDPFNPLASVIRSGEERKIREHAESTYDEAASHCRSKRPEPEPSNQ